MRRSIAINEIINDLPVLEVRGDTSRQIGMVCTDSREVTPGSLFIAVRGTLADGHDHIRSAVEGGATAVMAEWFPEGLPEDLVRITVADSGALVGAVASAFFGHPSRELELVGITGTNGKTTTATLLFELVRSLGYEAGLVSTVTYRIGQKELPATHTTPDPVSLNRLLREMADAGCQYCFMEVSSHSIVQNRIGGLTFRGGVFTNITHDHLDYHGTFAGYIQAKKTFFDRLPRGAFALVNADDRNGKIMVQNTPARISTFSLKKPADFRCRILEKQLDGMLLAFDRDQVWVSLSGVYNASNLLAVYSAAMLLELDRSEILSGISALKPVDGRMEIIRSSTGITAVVDYAHTPDALKNVCEALAEIKGGGRLIVVVGCGGDRDREKRPLMGRIAAECSDIAIFTSDNPRSEDPAAIITSMKEGALGSGNALSITDRAEAIGAALGMALTGDVVLVAGKGHETYQEICGIRNHFDDREVIRNHFKTTAAPAAGDNKY